MFLVTRAPGKRKIKVQEKNLLQLMEDEQDDDEEDDEDFQVNEEQDKAVDGIAHFPSLFVAFLHSSVIRKQLAINYAVYVVTWYQIFCILLIFSICNLYA